MWQCFIIIGLFLSFQTLKACECGKHKRATLMERSYLSPLAQSNYDVGGMRSNQFLTQKLPYTLPLTSKALSMNYNLAPKNQRPNYSSLTEATPNVAAAAATKSLVDPTSKLSDLLSLRLTLKAQKEAIKIMEDQLSLQIAESVRQFGIGDDPVRKPINNELYTPPQNGLGHNYQAPTNPQINQYPSSMGYGALGSNDLFHLGPRKEPEGQEAVSNVKPLMAQQMTAYSPYSRYSTSSSNPASSYTGASSPTNLGYQTALA